MRPTGLLLAGIVVALASRPIAAAPRPQPRPVKLLVTVVIDGVSWPRLEQARPLLKEGLKRMLDEGHVFTKCGYKHLNTETSPGHAALSTGAPPRVTGIVGNRWFRAPRTARCSSPSPRTMASRQFRRRCTTRGERGRVGAW